MTEPLLPMDCKTCSSSDLISTSIIMTTNWLTTEKITAEKTLSEKEIQSPLTYSRTVRKLKLLVSDVVALITRHCWALT